MKPVAQPLRRTPFNLRQKVEKKIKELLDMDIIEPVNGPTPWVNAAVIVPKANGDDIRLCVDMRRANEAIIRGRHPIPTVAFASVSTTSTSTARTAVVCCFRDMRPHHCNISSHE